MYVTIMHQPVAVGWVHGRTHVRMGRSLVHLRDLTSALAGMGYVGYDVPLCVGGSGGGAGLQM